jgi:ribonuclease D
VGASLTKVFDTQIAAGLCNEGYSLGYASLVKALLSVDVEKGETRSNWLNRPLTEAQEKYASIDVLYLHPLYQKLMAALESKNVVHAVYEDTGRLIEQSQTDSIQTYYLKLRGGWKLPPENQHVLKNLCQWRELKARTRNIPRSRVAEDNDLLEIATHLPKSAEALLSLPGIKHWMFKKEAALIVEMIKKALEPSDLTELTLILPPLDGYQQLVYRKLKNKIAGIAGAQNIPPEMLASKRILEKTILDSFRQGRVVLVAEFSGWRGDLIGAVVDRVVSEELTEASGSRI